MMLVHRNIESVSLNWSIVNATPKRDLLIICDLPLFFSQCSVQTDFYFLPLFIYLVCLLQYRPSKEKFLNFQK